MHINLIDEEAPAWEMLEVFCAFGPLLELHLFGIYSDLWGGLAKSKEASGT